jgi:hypothetical protein
MLRSSRCGLGERHRRRQAGHGHIVQPKSAGIEVLTRQGNAKVAEIETAIADARPPSMRINSWESRWPLNNHRTATPARSAR